MTDYLTSHFPGIGGLIKEDIDDFFVEEIPLYLPCGEGEHLYLTIEKRGLTTFALMQQLARELGIRERDMGYAGLKDARATTRQTISLPGVSLQQIENLQIDRVTVLSAAFHRNKLRPGHLAGNRFRIRIREAKPDSEERARDVLHVLEQLGVPNFFGQQRYGSLGNSHLIGHALLRKDFTGAVGLILGDPQKIEEPRWREGASRFHRGDLAGALEVLPGRMRDERRLLHGLQDGLSAQQAVMRLPQKLLRLYLSAYQSHLFDRVVAMRLSSLETLWQGDLAYKHDNGACFLVEDPAAEQSRAERLEISPSGPMFGFKMTMAQGQAGILETALLDKEGLSLEDFRLGGGLNMDGERRPLRIPLQETDVEGEGPDLILSFILPKGAYATSVLREVMKVEQPS